MRRLLATGLMLAAVVASGAESLEPALQTAALDYGQRLDAAARELTETRAQIARERAPIAAAARELENRLVTLEAALLRLQTSEAQAGNLQVRRQRDNEAIAQNLAYISTAAKESVKVLESGLLPGEGAVSAKKIEMLKAQLDNAASATNPDSSLELVDFLLARVRQSLGGRSVPGNALAQKDNRIVEGTFVFFGPETFFSTPSGADAGVVRAREGAPYPVVYALPGWKPADAVAVATGQDGVVPADPTGGRALRLQQAKGTWLDHLRRGGMVGYLILSLGFVAVMIAGWKLFTLRQRSVDQPRLVRPALELLAAGQRADAARVVAQLNGVTQKLFAAGLTHWEKSKEAIEEKLYALVLQERMQQEKRLPLLAVIVTASPLLGLLGTVTGMVKTFTLITIYGTGNAGRLSSGISEALVTTELGLMVAIPTLIAHGYFAHRVKRNIAALEFCAVGFANAAEEARSPAPATTAAR